MKPGFAFALIFFAMLRLAAQDVPPRVTYQEAPVYPREMRRKGLRGLVEIGFVVDSKGQVRDPIVISSTNPGLNQSAIDAVLKWRFEPGLRQGVPVNVRMEVPISFQLDGPAPSGRDAFLQDNILSDGVTPGGGSEPYQVSDRHVDQSELPPELRYDTPPKPANVVFAVYPFELLRDGVDGTADVRFLVSPNGKVAQATVVKATRPEFGQALLAMLDEWKFQPAMKDGKPTLTVMDVQQEFSDSGGDVPVSNVAKDLLHELKKAKLVLCPLKDLDAPPQVLSQHPPVFPSALVGKVTEGQAAVEFLIDHDGNVQLPRVVSATDPAFGYAAVQGVSAWKFAPPTSHGQPVAVRAKVPVDFVAPKLAPAADSVSVAAAHDNLASDAATANDAQIFNMSEADRVPVARFQSVPQYPLERSRTGVTGRVDVGFICDTEGHVRDAHVVASSGSSELDQAAVEGVSKWIFKPAMKDGRPINVRMEVPIQFNIERD